MRYMCHQGRIILLLVRLGNIHVHIKVFMILCRLVSSTTQQVIHVSSVQDNNTGIRLAGTDDYDSD